MKKRLLITLFSVLMISGTALAQSSWLDRPLNNWNNGTGVVPNAPRTLVAIEERCREQIRTPDSLADRAVTRAGWSLFGAAQVFGTVSVVNGMAGVDGMCRPSLYNTFVFVNNRFAGTLSPTTMSSRSDGALTEAHLTNPTSITAEFVRYKSSDALCCPSQTSSVSYSITSDTRVLVKADNVQTNEACPTNGEITTQDNVVSGTITYRQRSALPATAVLIVKIVDVSRADVSSMTVAEQRIETAGKQVPIPFDMAYDRRKIDERNRYAVQAEIRDGDRLLFISDTSYPVITQGNPRAVDITLVPVGGGGGGGFQGTRSIKGTVTYLQRIALGPNSEVTVRLIDTATPEGTPVAEAKVPTNGKQVPIPFELRYEQRDINRQRTYELRAEIRTDGRLRFRSANGQPIDLRGIQNDAVELIVGAGTDEPVSITGKTLSLSKFGTGSIKIGDRPSLFLIRSSVNVNTDGTATVSVSSLSDSTVFTGKLIYFDETTLRITIQSSGDADASGEIEIKYTAPRRLNSITSSNLLLDGQNVTLRF